MRTPRSGSFTTRFSPSNGGNWVASSGLLTAGRGGGAGGGTTACGSGTAAGAGAASCATCCGAAQAVSRATSAQTPRRRITIGSSNP